MVSNKGRERYTSKYRHKGREISSTLNNKLFEDLILNLDKPSNNVGYIPAGFDQRPDLISDVFYATPDLWWLILEASSKADPFEDLNPGDRVIIPKF